MEEHLGSPNSRGYEPIETDVRAVWRTGVVLAGTVIAAAVLVYGMMKWLTVTEGGTARSDIAQIDRALDEQSPLQRLRRQEQELLRTYEWVDSAAGVARIPIDRAMEVVSQSGLPASLPGAVPADTTSTEISAERDPDDETAERNE
jgi:hypothetical protein